MAPADTDDAALNEFLIAFARAILAWQHVEHTLFICFYKILASTVNGATVESAGAVFHAANFFADKLKAVDGLCKAVLNETELAKWQKLKRVLRNGAKNRNALAHLTIQSEGSISGPTAYALAPPLSAPPWMQTARKKIDAKECNRLRDSFVAIGHRLSAFSAPKKGAGRTPA